MHTVGEIQSAIRALSRDQQQRLADWNRDQVLHDFRVAEPALAYSSAQREEDGLGIESNTDPDLISIEQYLTMIQGSSLRHEYVGGRVYAMAGETMRHNEIVTNLSTAFKLHLRGGPCKVFQSSVLVGFKADDENTLYCPDLMVLCGQRDPASNIGTDPRLVIEVLSPSTERIDRREKAGAYRQISTMEEYVLIAQHAPRVTVYRRSEEWRPVVLTSLEGMADFRSIGLALPLRSIYDGL